MKVLDLMKKWCLTGNAKVIVRDTTAGKVHQLSKNDIQNFLPEKVMALAVNSVMAHENVVTIYAQRRR